MYVCIVYMILILPIPELQAHRLISEIHAKWTLATSERTCVTLSAYRFKIIYAHNLV